jgi:hypothetical protein
MLKDRVLHVVIKGTSAALGAIACDHLARMGTNYVLNKIEAHPSFFISSIAGALRDSTAGITDQIVLRGSTLVVGAFCGALAFEILSEMRKKTRLGGLFR